MHSEYSERPFAKDDAPYVVAAHTLPHVAGFVSAPPSERDVIDTLDAPNTMRRIVLDERGTRAGLWMASLHERWLVELRLIIATLPRAGAGRFALRSAMRWAFEEVGAHRFWLEVTADNAPARRLYESEGFVHEGTYRDGFKRNGVYTDLAHYGLLESEYVRPSFV